MKPTIDDLIEILHNNGFIFDIETSIDNCYVNSDQLNIAWENYNDMIDVFYFDLNSHKCDRIIHGNKNHLDVLILGLSKLINVPDWALGDNTNEN